MSSGKQAGLMVGLALTVLMVFGGGLSVARADTLYVNGVAGNDAWDGRCEVWDGGTCGPKATIQAGIDAATAGDEVVIAAGTYTGAGNKNLDFAGKAITVRGASGDPALCIIDCESDGRGFYFHSGEGADSVVQGLTITNGRVDPNSPGDLDGGGAVCCRGSSPTFVDCTICNSAAYDAGGGGVFCGWAGNATFTRCSIRGNAVYGYGDGGGLLCDYSGGLTLVDCTVSDNHAESGCGGVHCCSSSHLTMTNCVVQGNWANHTGGVYVEFGTAIATDCTLTGNSSMHRAGGFGAWYSDLTLVDCAISGNSSHVDTGGLDCADSDASVTHCTIAGNTGGGVSCGSGDVAFTNCTISQNTDGSGVYCYDGSPTFTNCVISENEYFLGGGVACHNAAPMFTYCTISDNTGEHGGGISGWTGSPTLVHCAIRGNRATHVGGAMYCFNDSRPAFVNCDVSDNTANDGGALYSDGSRPTVFNCTFLANNAGRGATLFCASLESPSTVTMSNCILWNHATEIQNTDGSLLSVTYCDVKGGWSGEGNCTVNPLVLDADGPDDDPDTWADNNYRLSPGSPCIDVGNNAAVPADLLFDLDGQPRIADGDADGDATVDMGAYERPATILGDLNCDGVISFGDINPFVLALIDPAQYVVEHPGCPILFADINQDGAVTFGDINPFVDLLLGH